jgi:serine protease Do
MIGGRTRMAWATLVAFLVAVSGAACRQDGGTGADQEPAAPDTPAFSANRAVAAQPARGPADELTPRTEPPAEAVAISNAFASAAEAIRPSVVRLDVESGPPRLARTDGRRTPRNLPEFFERFFDFDPQGPPVPEPRLQRGTGSGVIIDSDGHVLTNSHVIRGAQRVTIGLVDGRRLPGRVVGRDPWTDIGVVRFEEPPRDLVAARFGDSDQLRVGQWVIAVGSPLGLAQTVTAGIVSGMGRTGERFRFVSGERVQGYIQTDAQINPGNSGGPLVNLHGEVVGINTLINVGPGGAFGFAIPINQVREVAQVLIKEGRVVYPYIGVSVMAMENVPDEIRQRLGPLPESGAFIAQVTAGGPAAQAGLQPADVLTRIAGQVVTGPADVIDVVSAQRIGAGVQVEYVRDGRNRRVEVTLAELPTEEAGETPGQTRIGVALQTVTEPIARSLGVDPRTRGAVVTEVAPDSPAARAGLQPGDVIIEVNRRAVRNAQEVMAALGAEPGRPKLLRVTNARGTRFVTVTGD